MRPSPPRLALLVAASLVTAALAVVGTPAGLAASEAESVARPPPDADGHHGPRNLTLDGRLVNASSGAPVAGAAIAVDNLWTDEEEGYRSHESFHVETNETGGFSVNVSKGEVDLRIDDPDYQVAHTEFEIDDNLTLEIPLEPADRNRTTIHGTIADGEGEPVENAYVRVSPAPRDCGEEHCPEHRRTEDAGRGSSRTIDTKQGEIRVRYQPRTDRHVSTVAGDDGSYELSLPAGEYTVRARQQGYLEGATTVEGPQAGQARADVTLTEIPDASVTVTGVVRDASTGEAIEQARVSVDNQAWGTYNSTRTDDEGRFSVSIQPGYATVTVEADETYYVPCDHPDRETEDGGDGEATRTSRPRPVDCEPRHERGTAYLPASTAIQPDAGETVELDRQLEPEPEPTARIEGWVVNASSDEPVPNASLMVKNEVANEWGHAETGSDGSFAIDVREGYYTVQVRADGYFANRTNLVVEADETLRTTLNLTPGEPADGRYHHTPQRDVAHETSADAAAGGGSTDEATETNRPDGRQAYEGGPGELGAYPGSDVGASSNGSSAQTVPVLAPLAVGLTLAVGAALAGRRAW